MRDWLRGWWRNHSAVVATVALVVSSCALITSVITARNQAAQLELQANQLSVQSGQLRIQSEQFEDSKARFYIDARLEVLKPDRSYSQPVGGKIRQEDLQPGYPDSKPYLLANATNIGGTAVSISQVGFRTATGRLAWGDRTFCSVPSTDPISSCSFPFVVEPQQTVGFYIELGPDSERLLSCYLTDQGFASDLEFGLSTVPSELSFESTATSIYWFENCPSGSASSAPPPTVTTTA